MMFDLSVNASLRLNLVGVTFVTGNRTECMCYFFWCGSRSLFGSLVHGQGGEGSIGKEDNRV